MTAVDPMIVFRNVCKNYGDSPVLSDVSLLVKTGQMCVLCGPSGAGKSTLLATVNGLEPIDRGEIWIEGRRLGDRSLRLRELRRKVGVVHQSFNLFPHLTVVKNLLLALERGLGLPRNEALDRANSELERVGLSKWRDSYPAHLSGGQQQRAAIARSLAMRPRVLLLDEPTSALDIENVEEVVATIRSLASRGMTILLATHQISLFADIADYFVCMDRGRIIEQGERNNVLADNGCQSKLFDWITRIQAMNGVRPASPGFGPKPIAVPA